MNGSAEQKRGCSLVAAEVLIQLFGVSVTGKKLIFFNWIWKCLRFDRNVFRLQGPCVHMRCFFRRVHREEYISSKTLFFSNLPDVNSCKQLHEKVCEP